MSNLAVGIYEQILDEQLKDLLDANPDLKPVLRKIDDELAPHIYLQFVGKLLTQALQITKKELRISLINRMLELLGETDGLDYLQRCRLLSDEKNLLTEVRNSVKEYARPETPLSSSALLTGQGIDTPLEHELRAEMLTADRVDVLISFIKWSGLRLLMPLSNGWLKKMSPFALYLRVTWGPEIPALLNGCQSKKYQCSNFLRYGWYSLACKSLLFRPKQWLFDRLHRICEYVTFRHDARIGMDC